MHPRRPHVQWRHAVCALRRRGHHAPVDERLRGDAVRLLWLRVQHHQHEWNVGECPWCLADGTADFGSRPRGDSGAVCQRACGRADQCSSCWLFLGPQLVARGSSCAIFGLGSSAIFRSSSGAVKPSSRAIIGSRSSGLFSSSARAIFSCSSRTIVSCSSRAVVQSSPVLGLGTCPQQPCPLQAVSRQRQSCRRLAHRVQVAVL